MLFYRIMAFIRGYLILSLRGESLVKLVNLATANGIYLWDIRRFGAEYLRIKVGIRGFFALRPFLYKTRSQCRVVERVGLPFYTGRLWRRPFWLLGFVGAALMVIAISSLVLFIRIEGTTDPDGKIVEELRNFGVQPGVIRGRIISKVDTIERALRSNHPELLWVNLQFQGVLLKLSVVRRTIPPVRRIPKELVAVKDGKITRLTVIQGTALVQEGDTVAQGDSLLAGYQLFKDLNGGTVMEQVEPKGYVEAEVGYEAVVEEPLWVWKSRPTGRKRTLILLRYGKDVFPIFSWGSVKGQVFHLLSRKTLLKGRNPLALVELFSDCITEVRWERRNVRISQALASVRRESREKLPTLANGKKLIRSWEDWHIKDHWLIYRRTVEVSEEIARPVWEE